MGCAVPCVFIAGGHVVSSVVVLGDCEVQGVNARAIIVVCIVIGVGSTHVVAYIMPSVLLTGILVIGVVSAVIYCDVEGVNVSAS